MPLGRVTEWRGRSNSPRRGFQITGPHGNTNGVQHCTLEHPPFRCGEGPSDTMRNEAPLAGAPRFALGGGNDSSIRRAPSELCTRREREKARFGIDIVARV
jgi:hypothetical protein